MINGGIIIKFVVFLTGLVACIAAAKVVSKKNGTTRIPESNTSSQRIEYKKQSEPNKTEPPKADWVKLYEEKCDLEQKMVRLAGGDTGMIAYKNILEKSNDSENSKKEENIEMYRDAYKRKYEHFRTSYERYSEILKEAEKCPEDMRNMFLKTRDEDIYQDLLKFNP